MSFELTHEEVRVLGAMIEKDMATPEYYPLSFNALVNACNQKSNRDPAVNYDETTVRRALDGLRAKNLALVTTGGDNRVPKHSHRISETLNLGNRELAILCVLMLRGPQTVGELKGRTQRLHDFDDLAAVEACLKRLMEREPDPLVTCLPRQSGMRDPRYAHLLAGQVQLSEPPRRESMPDRIAALEAELDSLRSKLADLQQQFDRFRSQFE